MMMRMMFLHIFGLLATVSFTYGLVNITVYGPADMTTLAFWGGAAVIVFDVTYTFYFVLKGEEKMIKKEKDTKEKVKA